MYMYTSVKSNCVKNEVGMAVLNSKQTRVVPYYLANTPPSRQRPLNSFDENYCAGTIISEDSDCG